jgi:hypothetical protein
VSDEQVVELTGNAISAGNLKPWTEVGPAIRGGLGFLGWRGSRKTAAHAA